LGGFTVSAAIFLFCKSTNMAQPWLDAGHDCYLVDTQHPLAYEAGGITSNGNLHLVHADLSAPWLPPVDRNDIVFVAAFPPCDHLSVSGARWFKGKGLRRLSDSIAMFATAAEFCEWADAPYLIENPVSTISSYWRKPDYSFHPWQFADYCESDNYTKKTCLWTGGGFVMPSGLTEPATPPDDRIHKCPPSDERANIRSQTPLGFSRAIYESNAIISTTPIAEKK
jgi:hypothetical protein